MHATRRKWAGAVFALVSAAVLAVGLAGCAPRTRELPPGAGEPDKFLFERGSDALQRKKWMRAREYFSQLVDNYPQSPYRPDAKLALGDTYLGENNSESLVLAQNEFREFLTFYPTNRRADYAQYKLGLSHYKQMLAPQRDQTQTREALAEFDHFLERYPNSSLVPEVQKRIRECKDRLGDADFAVGVYYYRARWYPGAVDRFQSILKKDAEYSGRDALYYYLADAYVKLRQQAQALPYLDRLQKEFQRSEYLERGKRLADDIKNGVIREEPAKPPKGRKGQAAPPAPEPAKPEKGR